MAEKIRIIRALANPIAKRRKKKKSAPRSKRRPTPRRYVSKRRYVIRALVMKGGFAHADYWTGSSWRRGRRHAFKYPGSGAAMVQHHKAANACPKGCVAIDILPA